MTPSSQHSLRLVGIMVQIKSSALYREPLGTNTMFYPGNKCSFVGVRKPQRATGVSQDRGPATLIVNMTPIASYCRQVALWLERWTSNRKVARLNLRADKVKIGRSAPEQAVNPLFLGRH